MRAQIQEKDFENIYRQTYNKLLRYIVIKCNNIDDISDILQETYIELLKKIRKKKVLELDNIESFIFGISNNIIKRHFYKKKKEKSTKICTVICLICIIGFVSIFWQIIALIYIAYLPTEYVTKKDNREMVGYVKAFLRTEVDYYDYYNMFLRGKHIRIIDDYGKGGFDPLDEKMDYKHEIIKSTYYDKNGKVINTIDNTKHNTVIVDSNNKIDTNNNFTSSYEYDHNKTPSDVSKEDILYEKDINENKKIRVVYVESILAQRSIIRIEKTEDGGKTWLSVHETSDDYIQIHNGADFAFIDENIGFINDYGLAGTDGENRGLMVTNNGGKAFEDANIIHPNNIEERNLFIKGVPYEKNGTLKVQIYTINHSKDPERTYYEFISKDKGKNWKYDKIIKDN